MKLQIKYLEGHFKGLLSDRHFLLLKSKTFDKKKKKITTVISIIYTNILKALAVFCNTLCRIF